MRRFFLNYLLLKARSLKINVKYMLPKKFSFSIWTSAPSWMRKRFKIHVKVKEKFHFPKQIDIEWSTCVIFRRGFRERIMIEGKKISKRCKKDRNLLWCKVNFFSKSHLLTRAKTFLCEKSVFFFSWNVWFTINFENDEWSFIDKLNGQDILIILRVGILTFYYFQVNLLSG